MTESLFIIQFSYPGYSLKFEFLQREAVPEVFTGKHLCQSPFFTRVADLRPATLLKKRLWHRCFPANFVKFLRTPFLQTTSERLVLFKGFPANFVKFLRTPFLQTTSERLVLFKGNFQRIFKNLKNTFFQNTF